MFRPVANHVLTALLAVGLTASGCSYFSASPAQ